MSTLLVVRHGHAGDREKWEGPDERRPLSAKGRRQAVGLVDLLADFDITRVLSSHYLRCLESVVPLASHRRRSIELHPALAEGSSAAAVGALVTQLADDTAVFCTHGDVIYNLLVDLAHHDDDLPMSKGSTWVLAGGDGTLTPLRYLPPPPAPMESG